MKHVEEVRRSLPWVAAFLVFSVMAVPILHRGWTTLGTDFPNYYLLAHLSAQGITVDRAYEWIWLQRQKDHLGLAQPLVGLGQITPFSAAVLWPVARLSAMTAKHCWMTANGVFLGVIVLLLRRVTKAALSMIVLLAVCCVPLWRNFEYGQFYLLLLVLIVLAFWLTQRGKEWSAGFVIGLAAAFKVFPILLLVVPLARGRWRAVGGAALGLLLAAALSVRLFGLEFCRRYGTEVLPRGLRGDVADPYSLGSGSLEAALRRAFVFDPGLNPHPFSNAPWMAGAVVVAVSLVVLGFTWRAAASGEESDSAWALVVLASLLISSAPASYQFVLLLLPVCVLLQRCRRRWRPQCFAVGLYLFAVAPWPPLLTRHMWFAWLLPRWWATCSLFFLLLWRTHTAGVRAVWPPMRIVTAGAGIVFAMGTVVAVAARHPKAKQLQLAGQPGALFEGRPQWTAGALHGVRLQGGRYMASPEVKSEGDQLALAAAGRKLWVEQEGPGGSTLQGMDRRRVDGESPALSPAGKKLVFLREAKGRGVLYSSDADGSGIRERIGGVFDVYEASVDDRGAIYLAAQRAGDDGPRVYSLAPDTSELRPLIRERSRYPAVSPDGSRLAFSEEVHGSWQLRILDLHSGEVRHLKDFACNVTEPGWKSGNATGKPVLLVSSDCGRGLGLTAAFELTLP